VTDPALSHPLRSVASEEAALLHSAVVIERSDRRRWRISGPKTLDVLNGLVTNDVSKVSPGGGCYAGALTPKGKVIADLRIFAREADYIVETSAAAGAGWAEVLRKYVNPRLAKYEEITDQTADIAVAGVNAAAAVAAVFKLDPASLQTLEPHAHAALPIAGILQLAVSTPETGGPAYDLLLSAQERARAFGLLREAGAVPASLTTWEVRRIATGWPMWGRDMDENTLAQEANLDAFAAISYDKGCYTGQETVARVHFRGHVNRYLRRVRYSPDTTIPSGAELLDSTGKSVGDLRSSAISTIDGGVGIAMVRREVIAPATLGARWDESNAEVGLPPEDALP
jgi:tRNA-modifying protein YgfZ